MPRVVNKHWTQSWGDDAVYIGRPSKWGNPFTHEERLASAQGLTLVESRDDAVEAYRRYILDTPELMDALGELSGKDLVCWCKPAACHGDVLLELANA
jgi:hypothetical protein